MYLGLAYIWDEEPELISSDREIVGALKKGDCANFLQRKQNYI